MCPVTGDRSFANLGQVLRLHHGLGFAFGIRRIFPPCPVECAFSPSFPGFIEPCLPSPADKPPSGANLAGTVGSAARFQILMALWATKGKGISHKDIVCRWGVTRATVSGLMAALESEGLVKSYMNRDDRRKLNAQLTSKGDAVIKKAFELNLARFRAVFASLSPAELTSLMGLLQRVRETLAATQ